MKKSYHLSKDDLIEIIENHFSKLGEKVTHCYFKVGEYGGDWCSTYYDFNEIIVSVDIDINKENNGT